MTKNIVKTTFIPSAPEDVWEALTNPGEISAWLMPTENFKAVEGEVFSMQARPMGQWDGKIYGKILRVQAPKILCYTWKGDQMKSNTIIMWMLEPQNNGTLLTLHHTGFSGFSDYMLGVFHAMGWGKFIKKLKRLIASR